MGILARALARRSPRPDAHRHAGRAARRWGLGLALALCVGAGAATQSQAATFPPPWVGNGPFGGGGAVQSDPNTPGRLYLFAAGGPYQSDSHGSSWTPTTAITGNTPFVYAPSDSSRAYRVVNDQLYSSHDAGASWTQVATLVGRIGLDPPLAVSPVNADVVYAPIWVGYDDHLGVSRDGGVTWTTIDEGITRVPWDDGGNSIGGLLVTHIFVDPTDPRHVIVDAGTGTWESGDDGATWHPYAAVTAITAEPGRPTHWIGLDPAGHGMISSDAGLAWTPIGVQASLVIAPLAARGGVLYAMARDPSGARLMRSGDDGATWTTGAVIWLPSYSPPIVSLDTANPDRLFAVDENGQLVRTNDGGASWQPAVTGVPDSQVDSIVTDPARPGWALVVADGALQETSDGGRSWTARPTPPGVPLQIVRAGGDPSLLYDVSAQTSTASPAYQPFTHTLYRSEDGGTTWQPIRAETSYGCAVSVPPVASTVVYLVCERNLVRSSDGGSTWGPTRRLPFDLSPPARPAITIDRRDPNILYAATVGQGVYRSRNGGSTWQQLTASPVGADLLVQSQLDLDVLYVVGFVYQAGSAPITLRRSDDGGTSWHDVPAPGWVTDVAVGPNGVVYASMQRSSLAGEAIMASPDGGATWIDMGEEPYYATVAAVSGPSPGRLWAIGFGGVHSRPGVAWTGPRLAGAVSVRLARGGTLINGRVPLILHWPAATPGASPICGYRVEASAAGGAWSSVGRDGPGNLRHVLVRPDRRTAYRVQAVACSGAVSTWIAATPIVTHISQETAAAVETGGSWRRVIDARASAGAQLVAIGGGAALAFHATAITDVALVSTTGPAGGWPHVRINLGAAALVSQRSKMINHRRIVFTRHLAEPEAIYLTIRSGGTTTARTTVDAIVTLRPAPAAA